MIIFHPRRVQLSLQTAVTDDGDQLLTGEHRVNYFSDFATHAFLPNAASRFSSRDT